MIHGMDRFDKAFYFIAIFVVTCLAIVMFKTVTTPSIVTYCYIEVEDLGRLPSYSLKGHVEWHPDRNIGYFVSLNEAQNALNLCPIGR
jgi:hypothetical protein